MKKWTIESEKEVFGSGIFSLRKLHCTHPAKEAPFDFYTLKTSDWINIVAVTVEGRFIMVRQHRLGTDEITVENPGGLVEPGESPEESAGRELREETGYEAGEIAPLMVLSVNPAIMNNRVHLFCARNCRKVSGQELDGAEDIEVALMDRAEVLQGLKNGIIHHSIAVTALLLYFSMNGEGSRP